MLYQSVAPAETAEAAGSLTPMQQGMLCQSLRSPEGSGVYVEQVVARLREALDVPAFLESWRQVVARHPALRTRFEWQDLPTPRQFVLSQATIPLFEEDWRGSNAEEDPERRLHDYLAADRQRSFDLAAAPPLRLALLRLAEAEWRCVWTVHHILVDGRSMANVLREVFLSYDAVREGRACDLPEAPPYCAYIDWLGRHLEDDAAKAFWRTQLEGFSGPTTLPFPAPALCEMDEERRQTLSDRLSAALVERELDEALTEQIRALAAKHGITLNTILLGAWALLLSRYSGEDDVLFGATKAVRHCAEAAPQSVGVYINTLPFRVRVDPEASLRSWLEGVRKQWVALRAHEHTPLSRIHAVSGVPGGTALFEAYYVFERESLDAAVKSQGGRWDGRSFELIERTPLPIILAGHGGTRLSLTIEYDRRRFNRATVRRALGHLHTILEAMVSRPDAPLKTIPILSAEEERRFLVDWQPAVAQATPNTCIHHLFERAVLQSPAAVALCFEDRQLSYQELNARANRLAHYLQEMGVRPDTPVGLCLPRSLEMVIGLWGILKAGGAYLPMDPAYPDERLGYMLEDAHAPVLVTDSSLVGRLAKPPKHTVCVDADAGRIARCSDANPRSGVEPGNLCYIIYTSGSTGRPKGVMIEHQSLVDYICSAIDIYRLGPADRVLQFASLSFDAAAEEISMTLAAGATLVLRTDDALASVAGFYRFCSAWGVTVLDLPTAYWHVLAGELDSAPLPREVRLVIIGGEAARQDKLARWIERVPPSVRLINSYGPTEATVAAVCCDLDAAALEGEMPIGYPMPCVTAYALDPELRLVPVGMPGELYLGGRQLARGYVGRPDLTEQSFVPHPFREHARLYRTGDRVRCQEDGKLVYLGRFDRQVKIRGFRIELGELETVLARHPEVKDAAVVVREDVPGSKQLAAYVVPAAEAAKEDLGAAVRVWLQDRLPAYMQPSMFITLDRLPLTASGKLDRRALPAPAPECRERSIVAPHTPTESELLEIWRDVLCFAGISCDDDFFALGGDSLLAVQVLARISRTLDVELPLQRMFEYPSIAAMAAHLDSAPRVETCVPCVARREGGSRFPLTFDQEILWLFEQVYPATQTYHIPMAYRIRGPVDVEVLSRCLSVIVERHEPLRTVFELGEGGTPEQIVLSPYRVVINVEELGTVSDAKRPHAIQQWLCTASCVPFDVRHGPLFRAVLLRIADDDYLLSMTVHHLVSDGWSVGALIKELNALYRAFHAGVEPALPDLPIRYADFVRWQRDQFPLVEGRVSAYWREQLAPPLPRLAWPDDPLARERPDPRQGAQYPLRLSKGLMEKLGRLTRKTGATPFMTLLAIYDLLLHGYTGAADVLVAATTANRNRVETEPLIGFFINTIVLRTRLASEESFDALLQRVRGVVLGAYAHQEMPYHKLRDLAGANDPDRPLIQALFLMQTMDVPSLRLPGATTTTLNVDMGKSLMDLTLELYETADGMSGWLEYRTRLFSYETIRRLAAYFVRLAETVADAPETRLSEFPSLGAVTVTGEEAPPAIWEVPPAPDMAAIRPEATGRGVIDGPPDATEIRLAELWREVLGLKQIGRYDNFFDIGGHSLAAVVLLGRIEKVFGKRLRPLRLYQAPTVAQLARFLREESPATPHRALHAIQRAGGKPPLFFVGSTDMIPPLAPVLGQDQPLYSLNIFGLQREDGTTPRLDVAEIARRYIEEMRTVQRCGPYFLAAYCRDAMVAYEMGRQLFADGEAVALLALIDAFWGPCGGYSWLGRQARNLLNFGPGYLVQKAAQRRKMFQERWRRVSSRLAERSYRRFGASLPNQHLDTLFINEYYDAARMYTPPPYPGRVTLLLASEWGATECPGWEGLARGVVVIHQIRACHHTLWKSPHIDTLARQLKACLEEAQRS